MPSTSHILLVEDHDAMRGLLMDDLHEQGLHVTGVSSLSKALTELQQQAYDLVITDLNLGQGSGMDLLDLIQRDYPDVPVILITAFGTMDTAIEAMRRGVYDFLVKPFDVDYLIMVCRRALEHRALKKELGHLRMLSPHPDDLDGHGLMWRRLLTRLQQIAPTRATILLQGESGTGKTRMAKLIHQMSPRAHEPLLIENMAAIPENLIESELFGHVKGAFTGATHDKAGLFERAHGGTLVLDEIGDMPLSLQPRLLSVLEERCVRPVGSSKVIPIDVRLIAATNHDLHSEVAERSFREDLFFRLAVMEIEIPPLRERGRDMLVLAQRFLGEAATEFECAPSHLSAEAARQVISYTWPGNVRELKHAMEQAALLAQHGIVHPSHLPDRVQAVQETRTPSASVTTPEERFETLEIVERQHILKVLHAVDDNKALAARILNIGRKTLYRKLDAWGIE